MSHDESDIVTTEIRDGSSVFYGVGAVRKPRSLGLKGFLTIGDRHPGVDLEHHLIGWIDPVTGAVVR